jgi:hypothetical protein
MMAGAMATEVRGREGVLAGYPARPTGQEAGMDRGLYARSAAGIPAAAAGVTGMTMATAGCLNGRSRVQRREAVRAGMPGCIVSRTPKRMNRKVGIPGNGLRTEATSSPGIPGKPAEGDPCRAPKSAGRAATGTAAASGPVEAVSGPGAAAAAGRTKRAPGNRISRAGPQHVKLLRRKTERPRPSRRAAPRGGGRVPGDCLNSGGYLLSPRQRRPLLRQGELPLRR